MEYINEKHIVTKIELATYIPSRMGDAVHKNRPTHGLALNCNGEKSYVFNDGTVCVVKENDIIYLPKNSNYTVNSKVKGDMYCINFQCLDAKAFAPFVLHVSNVDEMIKAYKNAETAWRRAKGGREYRALSELYRIFYEMRREQTIPYLPKTKHELIKPAIEYIHKNYTVELISIEKLSELCGISCGYLRRIFKKAYGTSPIKYINALKLKRAKELLASGQYTVSDVAYNSGFFDLSHFSRFFKENAGMLPSEYINE